MSGFLAELTVKDVKYGMMIVTGASSTFVAGSLFTKDPHYSAFFLALGFLIELSVLIQKNKEVRELKQDTQEAVKILEKTVEAVGPYGGFTTPDDLHFEKQDAAKIRRKHEEPKYIVEEIKRWFDSFNYNLDVIKNRKKIGES